MKPKSIKVILSKLSLDTLLAIQDPNGINNKRTKVDTQLTKIISKLRKS